MQAFCTAKNCQHSTKHNISGHYCHRCHKYGHGAPECNNITLIESLIVIPIPNHLQCTIIGCRNKTNHTTDGHKCRHCKGYRHGWEHCPKIIETRQKQADHLNIHRCSLCGAAGHEYTHCVYADPEKIAGLAPGKIYITIYDGMGCFSFLKRDSPSSKFEAYHMHSDNWGQYGFSKVPDLSKFLDGYKPFRPIDDISAEISSM